MDGSNLYQAEFARTHLALSSWIRTIVLLCDYSSASIVSCAKQAEEGCERSVITYSALIGTCEKAGRWRLALDLFAQMGRDGIAPNTAIYNATMSACAQGEPPFLVAFG